MPGRLPPWIAVAVFLAGCAAGPQPGDIAPAAAGGPTGIYELSTWVVVRDRAEGVGSDAWQAAGAAVTAAVVGPVLLVLWVLGIPFPWGK